MAEQYGVSSLVSFCGFARDLPAEMRSVDVVLCASECGSIPHVIPEAMAARRLVIAPSAGGIADIVSHGTGIPMSDNTAVSILQAFAEALKLTADEWRAKTNLAREVVRQECSKYPVSTELFRLYRQAAAGHVRTLKQPEKNPELAAGNGIGSGGHPGLRWSADKPRYGRRVAAFFESMKSRQ